MPRSELLYRGNLDLGDGSPARHLEVWKADGAPAAVAFDGGTQVGSVLQVTIELTDDGRLVVAGLSPEGHAVHWEAPGASRVAGSWPGQRITIDGEQWSDATITWTQYAVTISAAGHQNRVLPAARTEVIGAQRFVVAGSDRWAVENVGRSCGSCGRS